ncbi:hypothetical protein TPHA_0D01910 [Tetrapisispora phaffii CBS 4417]|uniref:Bis(5'-adenosyl)-triphosphatase n=1 Tax=Tetrapisispora phaffii (strain ATCC 24235 / CBS 4417 / NBRC 1672 / NRRL Y-8282 / UCD 70-5) TaxID=1071381 RepID=G8BSK9_TETPH|nr:hypothetical protein TPHA_0D01910 [Tetrapisispora phaffii CBS 4417]CCE62830.1 hypothetical protein TPHA_0D01910 [Tetrapisispora phaffii CBS 4417]
MSSPIYFSKFIVTDQVFYVSKFCYALVNLKPLVPGHVLIVPLRTSVQNLSQLSKEESSDFFNTVQLMQNFIYHTYQADAMNIAIQDGPEAGQSVPHLHTHIIPRYRLNNIGDQIYNKLDSWDGSEWEKRRETYLSANGRMGRKELAKPEDQRVERTAEVMKKEAITLNEKLQNYITQNPDMKKWID